MDGSTRQQTRLILEHQLELSKKDFGDRWKGISEQNAARGCLQSGATIRQALRTMEEVGGDFITVVVDQIISIAKNRDAFAMIYDTAETLLTYFEGQVDSAVTLATGKKDRENQKSAFDEAGRLFDEIRAGLRRKLEIHRFSFVESILPIITRVIDHEPTRNRGGKPLAAHWDEMWAVMAVALYAGDLQPKSQADIERAMKDWLASRDLDSGDTAVRDRARTLWRKLVAAN